jgi:hypothetical protein
MEEKDLFEIGNEISYVPMDEDMQFTLYAKYTMPLQRNIILLIVISLLFYGIVAGAANTGTPGSFYLLLAIVMSGIDFFMVFTTLLQYNLAYKKDAQFGKIVKEKAHISAVYSTPVGYNIYWLDSLSIMTFNPDPYRSFNVGDAVTIYYLKFSKQYLAYEI